MERACRANEAAADAMTGAPDAADRAALSRAALAPRSLLVGRDRRRRARVRARAALPAPAASRATPAPFPVCYINGTLEFPAPHVVVDLRRTTPRRTARPGHHLRTPASPRRCSRCGSSAALLLVVIILDVPRRPGVPGRLQNFAEWVVGVAGGVRDVAGRSGARRYIPIFASFFLLILVCNWSGLIPPVGQGRVPARARPAT